MLWLDKQSARLLHSFHLHVDENESVNTIKSPISPVSPISPYTMHEETQLFHHMGAGGPTCPSTFARAAEAAVIGEITGLKSELTSVNEELFYIKEEEGGTRVVTDLENASVLLLRTSPRTSAKLVHDLIPSTFDTKLEDAVGLLKAVGEFGDVELNVALFRCAAEDSDFTDGISIDFPIPKGVISNTYNVPGVGHLAYGGIQGVVSLLQTIIKNNDLGHPLCQNLREGNWMMQYTIERLSFYTTAFPKLEPLMLWLRDRFDLVSKMTSGLVPRCFLFSSHVQVLCDYSHVGLPCPQTTFNRHGWRTTFQPYITSKSGGRCHSHCYSDDRSSKVYQIDSEAVQVH